MLHGCIYILVMVFFLVVWDKTQTHITFKAEQTPQDSWADVKASVPAYGVVQPLSPQFPSSAAQPRLPWQRLWSSTDSSPWGCGSLNQQQQNLSHFLHWLAKRSDRQQNEGEGRTPLRNREKSSKQQVSSFSACRLLDKRSLLAKHELLFPRYQNNFFLIIFFIQ